MYFHKVARWPLHDLPCRLLNKPVLAAYIRISQVPLIFKHLNQCCPKSVAFTAQKIYSKVTRPFSATMNKIRKSGLATQHYLHT